MATWKSENSMLTQVGIEILNKLKAGIGSLTITRVVAGSGRVSPSVLFQQTSLSGVLKPMNITKQSSKGTGSEISIFISNENITEPFELSQIGIFVSHPDYDGERLYHISQCESEGIDVIPALSDTPVNFGYSIFLEHGNSSSLTLTIDPLGSVSLIDFSKFKANTAPNNLIAMGSDGNLKDTGRQSSEIPNPNLIHNWYFLDPVDQQNGYYALKGTTYYSETSLTTAKGNLPSNMKVTFVNTVYGIVTIGNATYYVPFSNMFKGYVGGKYSIDRWFSSVSFAEWNASGYRLRQESENGFFVQDIDRFYVADGRKVTLSVLLSNGELLTGTGIVPASPTTGVSVVNLILGTQASFECYRRSDNRFIVQFRLSPGADIIVRAVKLEFGSVQTLAYKDANDKWVLSEVPSYASQMAICKQYDPSTGGYIGFNYSLVAPATLE